MKVRFWKQHSMETCGVACLLMVLDAFGIDYPTVSREQHFYRRLRSRAAPGTEGGAIACALAKYGLTVTLAHSGTEVIDDPSGYYPAELRETLLAENRAWLSRAPETLRTIPGCTIDADFLNTELAQERLVISQVIIPGDADGLHDRVLHGVLLYGLVGNDVLLCDPLQGKRRIPLAELLRMMDTPVGRMAISAGRREGSR